MTESQEPIRQIDINIAPSFHNDLSESWIYTVVEAGLEVAVAPDEDCQVSLLVTGDAAVRQLNHRFRGLDEVTDVLSFSSSHDGHWKGEVPDSRNGQPDSGDFPFVLPPGELPPLGEVVISFPQAQRQALQRSQPVDQEMALLIVHGILHLVGHDHLEQEDTARMQAREQAALASVFQIGAANT